MRPYILLIFTSILIMSCVSTKTIETKMTSGKATNESTKLVSFIDQARTVSFYFSDGIDSTFSSIEEAKNGSNYLLEIRCYLDCSRYTSGILKHFNNSIALGSCPDWKDVYLTITFGEDRYITYLKWGKVILFNDNCFYNEQRISEFLPSPSSLESLFDE